MSNNLHIVGVTKSGECSNLRELLEPLYNYYNALQFTFNLPTDEGYDYLESIKKDGKIIKNEWNWNLADSRNRYLYNGTMKTGDFFINLDDKERLYPKFFEFWPQLRKFLINNDIGGVLLYGKRFIYRYHEYLCHEGNPHEYIEGANKVIELTQMKPFDETSWFWGSVRNQQRDKFEFVWHYISYFLNYPKSNQPALGNESSPEHYRIEETIRREFRYYLEQNNYLPLTIDKFKFLCNNKMDDIREFLNKSKICNDAYRFLVLGKTDFKDDHNFSDKIII